jgi:hypothetical protein
MDCDHKNVYDGACIDCGLEILGNSNGTHIEMGSSYSEYHSYIDPVNTQPFESDLKNLNIPVEIKAMVVSLANSCSRETHRMGVRRQQLFAYIYLAYLKTGFKLDIDKLKEEMKMTQREINMALRIVSGTSAVDIPLPTTPDGESICAPIVVYSPLIYIEDVCEANGLKDYTEQVSELAKVILSKSKRFLEENPKHVAIAILKYYLSSIGVNIPKYVKNNKISDSILKQHLGRIQKVMNAT